MAVKHQHWKNAALGYNNLSELHLSQGRIAAAVEDARQAEDYADYSGDPFVRMACRATLANALHQHGNTDAAREGYIEAEAVQAARQTGCPPLYSLPGFCFCDQLLECSERAAWRGAGDIGLGQCDAATLAEARTANNGSRGHPRLQDSRAVAARAAQTLAWAVRLDTDQLSSALDHLTLARCSLYADRLQGQPPGADAQREIAQAVAGLRAAGAHDHIPRGLLTRAWLRHCLDNLDGARADLDEAEQIAKRGNMRLHLADLHLTRARLFRDRAELAKARELIVECEYFRRLPELEDAEAALGVG